MRIKRTVKNIMNSVKNRKGFSLVEILVTVLIFSVLAAAVNAVLLVGDASWQTNSVQVELQQELRKAMDWMKDDLRQTGSAAIAIGSVPANGSWYTTIMFQKATGVSDGSIEWGGGIDIDESIQFILGGTDNNQLQKIILDSDEDTVSTKVLAQNIQTIQFRRMVAAPNVVEVALQAQKDTVKGNTITASLSFEIQMRN